MNHVLVTRFNRLLTIIRDHRRGGKEIHQVSDGGAWSRQKRSRKRERKNGEKAGGGKTSVSGTFLRRNTWTSGVIPRPRTVPSTINRKSTTCMLLQKRPFAGHSFFHPQSPLLRYSTQLTNSGKEKTIENYCFPSPKRKLLNISFVGGICFMVQIE